MEVVGNRVLFRGRQSDVINVGGVKVHPLPVEERIVALGCVEAARVFGRPSTLTGAIVAVDIVPAGGPDAVDADGIRAAVRQPSRHCLGRGNREHHSGGRHRDPRGQDGQGTVP